MTTRFQYRLIAALCVLATATAGGGLGAAVICVGSDGHAGIESLMDGCCLSMGAQASAPSVGSKASNYPCGDCVDVILEVSPISSRPVHLDLPSQVALECPACGSVCRRRVATTAPQPESSPPSLFLALLSSVVLLT
jgi:hypothetical protein